MSFHLTCLDVSNANTPIRDQLCKDYANDLISASGMDVGLPDGQMGNSEVGHTNIGAGRVVYQNLTRITKDILDGTFVTNPVLTSSIDKAVNAGKAVHIMGLLSPGGVHSHEDHIAAAVELAAKRGAEKIYLHAITDGRDTPPRSAQGSIELLENKFKALGKGRFASVIGRYFAMDRDKRWDRVELAYNTIVCAESEHEFTNPVDYINSRYEQGEVDEFIMPAVNSDVNQRIEDNDSVIFTNFRPDRAMQLAAVLTNENNFEAAKKTGVDIVGNDDLINLISQGDINFDLLIATPEIMPKLAKLGRILGPKGLMPSPKSGTVTTTLVVTILEFKKGKFEYKADKAGVVHVSFGKSNFTEIQLIENPLRMESKL